MKIKPPSFLMIGLALFSMFFGSGNLTFPLYIGQTAHSQWVKGLIGFLLSAVLLPFLGVLAMVIKKSNIKDFFKNSKFLIPILLTTWIPLGSGPRCISVAYAGVNIYFPNFPLWLFGIFYSILIFLFIKNKKKLLDLLGYVLTPLLLLYSMNLSLGIYDLKIIN